MKYRPVGFFYKAKYNILEVMGGLIREWENKKDK